MDNRIYAAILKFYEMRENGELMEKLPRAMYVPVLFNANGNPTGSFTKRWNKKPFVFYLTGEKHFELCEPESGITDIGSLADNAVLSFKGKKRVGNYNPERRSITVQSEGNYVCKISERDYLDGRIIFIDRSKVAIPEYEKKLKEIEKNSRVKLR